MAIKMFSTFYSRFINTVVYSIPDSQLKYERGKISTTIDVYGEYDDEEFMRKSKEGVQVVL